MVTKILKYYLLSEIVKIDRKKIIRFLWGGGFKYTFSLIFFFLWSHLLDISLWSFVVTERLFNNDISDIGGGCGGGVQKCVFSGDVICERPLVEICIKNMTHYDLRDGNFCTDFRVKLIIIWNVSKLVRNSWMFFLQTVLFVCLGWYHPFDFLSFVFSSAAQRSQLPLLLFCFLTFTGYIFGDLEKIEYFSSKMPIFLPDLLGTSLITCIEFHD